MYGDMMYCRNCGKIFKDTWRLRDTRTEQVLTNCPFCKSCSTINASAFIEKYEKAGGESNGGKYKTMKQIYEK
jgi:hypothetical protein